MTTWPSAVIFPDVLGDTRYWLRTHPALEPLHQGRVFFRLPDKISQFPTMRLYRVGGGVDANTETPIDNARLALDIWGGKGADYPAVRELEVATRSAIFYTPGNVLLNPTGNTILLNGSVNGSLDSPDPETGWPRYILNFTFRVIHSGSTV